MIINPEGVKSYKLWCLELGIKKCIISRDVVFNEAEMGYLVISESGMQPDESSKGKKVQVEVEPIEMVHDNVEGGQDSSDWLEQGTGTSSGQSNLSGYELTRDREKRTTRPLSRYGYADFLAFAFAIAEEIDLEEPRSYSEAMKSKDKAKWQNAMQEEIKSLFKNQTWKLVERPANQKVVGCKWIFKRKQEAVGNDKISFKARLVVQGFTQRNGVDFNEIFSPVVKHRSIRFILSLVAQFDLELKQMDVKTTFCMEILKRKS